MRVVVVGAGAIGSVVGGFLARAGHEVTLLGREAHMAAVARYGLQVTGIWGEFRVRGMCTACAPEEISGPAPDVVVVAVKSYDTAAVAPTVAALVGPETLVCAYQNGLGNAEILADVVGWDRLVGVRAIYGAWIPEPGTVDVTVIARPTALGVYTPAPPGDDAAAQALADAMDDADLPTVYDDAIATTIWGKVAYNCMLNPLSALLDVPYGALAQSEETRAIMRDVAVELYAVAAARGVALDPATPEEYLGHFYKALLPPTAAHYASMREDLRQGRRTEIDALNGAVARMGAEAGIATPANTLLTRLVKARSAVGSR